MAVLRSLEVEHTAPGLRSTGDPAAVWVVLALVIYPRLWVLLLP